MKRVLLIIAAMLLIAGCASTKSTQKNKNEEKEGVFTIDKEKLVGTWFYSSPACSFTDNKKRSKVNKVAVNEKVKLKLEIVYLKIGENPSNTYFTFEKDGTFQARMISFMWKGKYNFNPETGEIKFKSPTIECTGYITGTVKGLKLTFKPDVLPKVLKLANALGGESDIQTIKKLGEKYDGILLGFGMNKIRLETDLEPFED